MKKAFFALMLAVCMLLMQAGLADPSPVQRCIGLLEAGQPVYFEVSAAFGKLPQFDESRTEKLNRLLRHFSLNGVLDPVDSHTALAIDGRNLFTLSEMEYNGKKTRILSAGAEHAYVVPEDPEPPETGSAEAWTLPEDAVFQFHVLSSLEAYASFFGSLPRLFPEKAGTAKVNQKYPPYGTAVKKVTLYLTAEELTDGLRSLPGLFPDSELVPDPQSILFSGRQGFTLLFDGEDRLILVQYSGKAGRSEEDLRNVRLDWKTFRSDLTEKDELQLRTPNSAGTRRNNLILEHAWNREESGAERFVWKAENDDVADGLRTRGKTECELRSEDGKQLNGTYTRTVSVKTRSETKEAILSAGDASRDPFSGILEIISKKDKIETGRVQIRFSLSREVPLLVTAGQQEPEPVTDEEYAGILEGIYSDILRETLKLPGEDLLFLNEGIDDASWHSILQILDEKEPAI